MDVKYDMMADAVYLNVSTGKVAKTLEVQDRLNIDFDGTGRILGIEILEASHQEKLVASLKKNVEAGIPIDIVNSTPIAA
jgi:uncharacterized protein YuzE